MQKTILLHSRTGLLALVLSLATWTPAFGQPSLSVLFYGPTAATEIPYLPTNATVTVAHGPTWRAMKTSDFASYDLIIIGDTYSGSGPTAADLLAAYDTRNTWAAAVTGRIVVNGLDPGFHAYEDVPGARTYIAATLDWLTKGGKTALYVSSEWGVRNLDFLSPFGAFAASPAQADSITITSPSHPIMSGSTSASLSWWSSSAHSFITYPASFSSFATGTDLSTNSGSVVVARDTVLLQVRCTENELILSWSTNAVGFTLQSTLDSVSPITWVDVTNAPGLLGAQWAVTNTFSGSAQFYRLRKL
jgi:hypothetical protein